MKQELFGTLPRRIVLLLAIGLFIGLGCSSVYRATYSAAHRTDFTVYTAAGRAVLDGTSLYDAHNSRGWYYMYLPVFAVAMVPLAKLSTLAAATIWYLLSVAMLAHGLCLGVQLARKAYPNLKIAGFWLAALAGLVVLQPALSGMARGQISVALMYLVTLGVWKSLQGRPWPAGFCLTGAIILKIFPALLVAYFLLKKRWRTVMATIVGLLLLILVIPGIVFGPAKNLALLKEWTLTIAFPAATPQNAADNARFDQMIDPRNNRNQSLQAVIIRTTAGNAIDIPVDRERAARTIYGAVGAFMLIASIWVCRQPDPAGSARRTLLQICLVVLLMLVLAPVAWAHNYVLVLPPAAIALAAWFSDAPIEERRVLGLGVLVYALGSILSLYQVCSHFGTQFWGAFFLWAAFLYVLLMEEAGTIELPEKAAAEAIP